ncbi:hypothetical protein Misp05_05520 [Micromonospora sp. NBRC 107095]|nr:hypothetical protein Misp05_05520 [Micromonospora sp. NBRC 107095]
MPSRLLYAATGVVPPPCQTSTWVHYLGTAANQTTDRGTPKAAPAESDDRALSIPPSLASDITDAACHPATTDRTRDRYEDWPSHRARPHVHRPKHWASGGASHTLGLG